MTTSAGVLVAMLATACATETNPLAEAPRGEVMPADIARACDLASQRCSRCHSIERVVHAHIVEPQEWQRYVHKMRLMPGSDIPPGEEPVIARCLVFRVAGNAGLAKLQEAP
jgi:hypothetical protein